MNLALTQSIIIKDLKKIGTKELREKGDWYFKGVVSFLGLSAPQLDAYFKEQYRTTLSSLSPEEAIQLALLLLATPYFESKKVGILLLNKNIHTLTKAHLPLFARLFENDIYDWGTCDVFSSKVLTRMIKQDPSIAPLIKPWKSSAHLWQQRAACVAYVGVARFGTYNKLIIEICTTVINNPERFVQLGCGWVLRELSLADLELVLTFIRSHYTLFSREGLRYAIEKMDPTLRKQILKNIF